MMSMVQKLKGKNNQLHVRSDKCAIVYEHRSGNHTYIHTYIHTYSIIVITVGALGAVPKNLEENLQCLGMQRDRIQTIINRLQRAALLGSVKICKTVLKCN